MQVLSAGRARLSYWQVNANARNYGTLQVAIVIRLSD